MKKNFLITYFLIGSLIQLFAQVLYDTNTIQKIEITFSQANWDYMLDTAKAGSGGYIMAKSVAINGMVFDSVGVKYKGNSTYNPNQIKNPLHIELDTYKDQDYLGYTDLKLSNGAKDPTLVREILSYSIARQYMDASLANYANVYINGKRVGLYVNCESVSKKYIQNHFYSNDNPLFKCNPIKGAKPGVSAKPNLAFLGQDSSLYYAAYEMNSDYGWKDLINLTNTLNSNLANIESVLDVDRALWMLAFDNVLVNLDSYIGGLAQNYYLYKDFTGRFLCVPWDFNESFGTFNSTGTVALQNTSAKIQMSHLLHINDAGWPLIQKLFSVPAYKRMYLAHLLTIVNENFSDDNYISKAQSLQNIISTDFQSDPNKFYSFVQFQSNLLNDVFVQTNTAPGIKNLMGGRFTYLTSLADFTTVKPVVANVNSSSASPELNSTLFITARVTNANTAYLGYRYKSGDKFLKEKMYDDGLHSDGAAGDNIFGASIKVDGTLIQYYIYAENNSIGAFSPARAEHEFYTLSTFAQKINKGDLVINELMAQNSSTAADQNGQYDDWIELYNNTNSTLILDNFYLSDTYTNVMKWKFPSSTTILPKSYLIVWADEDGSQTGLHANFKLSANGECVIISDEIGNLIDTVSFGVQFTDKSFARMPDGTGNFVIQNPTFNQSNTVTKIENYIYVPVEYYLSQNYPNPFNPETIISYQISANSHVTLKVYDTLGREIDELVNENKPAGEHRVKFNGSKLSSGVYYYQISTGDFLQTKKMILQK